jgi:hypothetical protein
MVTEYEEVGQSNDNVPGCLLALDSSGNPSDQTWASLGRDSAGTKLSPMNLDRENNHF